MRVQAIGLHSTVELYDHHLVIKRHPGFLEASATELLVPLTNIVSVQFRRPALFTSGRLIIALQGAAQPKRTNYERRTDQTAIAFAKGQLAQFEEVLRVIRMAIATPSIEQLAMAAAQRHAVSDRVAQARAQPKPTRAVLERIDPPRQSNYNPNTGADYDETGSYGHQAYNHPSGGRDDAPPLNPTVGGWWGDEPLLVKIILIGIPLVLLLAMCSGPNVRPDQDPAGYGAAYQAPAADSSPTTVEQPPRLTPKQQLAAAFRAVFPGGEIEHQEDGNYDLTLVPRKLVPLNADGSVLALITEGGNPDACHLCLGRLHVDYVQASGGQYTAVQPAVQETLEGNGFGYPPNWKLIHRRDGPALRVEAGFTEQGCTATTISIYRLTPDGISEDKSAFRSSSEPRGCG